LPPKEEIPRIVAQVECLMKLCDDLEAKLRARDEKAAKLAEALVAESLA
jgi:restriction endonuclease S subunit